MRSIGRSLRAAPGLWKLARAVALLAPALGCAGASSSARPQEDDRCAQLAVDEAALPSEAWTLKLDRNISNRLREWRADAAYARCAGTDRRVAEVQRECSPVEGPHGSARCARGREGSPLASRSSDRVSVDVEYTGDLDSLRAAGLETGLDRDGTVSGMIAMRDLEALARVPGVVTIRGEGHPEPDSGGG